MILDILKVRRGSLIDLQRASHASASQLRRCLWFLEDRGLLMASKGQSPDQNVYSITPDGEEMLDQMEQTMALLSEFPYRAPSDRDLAPTPA